MYEIIMESEQWVLQKDSNTIAYFLTTHIDRKDMEQIVNILNGKINVDRRDKIREAVKNINDALA